MYVNPVIKANYNNVGVNHSFKGSIKQTEQGNSYYSSTSATNVGIVTAAIALGTHISNMFLKVPTLEEAERYTEKLKNQLKDNPIFKNQKILTPEEYINSIKNTKKYALPFALIAGVASLGCGMIVDKIRNEKAASAADNIKNSGLKNAMTNDEHIELSRKGKGYYNSNVGNKYGAILGAACGCIAAGMSYLTHKKEYNVLTAAISVCAYAFGGWLVGKFADSKTNKAAKIYT